MKKKIIALLSIIAVTSAFAGCQSDKNNSESDVINGSELTTESDVINDSELTTESDNNIIEKFNNSVDGKCWAGTNSGFTYAIAFSGDKVSISSIENEQEFDIEGYWSIENDEFYVYSDAEKTDELGLYSFKIPVDGEKMFIRLNEVVLIPQEDYTYDNISDSLDKLKDVEFVKELFDNSAWTYQGQDIAAILIGNNIQTTFYQVKNNGDFLNVDGYCGIDDKNMYFFDRDDNFVIQYEWEVQTNDSTTMILSDGTTKIELTKSENTDLDAEIDKISNTFSSDQPVETIVSE